MLKFAPKREGLPHLEHFIVGRLEKREGCAGIFANGIIINPYIQNTALPFSSVHLEMDVFEAIEKRRSIRNYEPTSVPKDKLEKILEAAILAPSASNLQPRHFIVVTDAEKRRVLSGGIFAKFLNQSPVVIVACGDDKKAPKWYAIDVAIATENMVLAATGEGLGTCWIGSFDEN